MGRLFLYLIGFTTRLAFSQEGCIEYSVLKQPYTLNIKSIEFCGDRITISERKFSVLKFQDVGSVVEITFGYPEWGGRKMGAIAIQKGKGELDAIIELYRGPDDPVGKTNGNLLLRAQETREERNLRYEEERLSDKKSYPAIDKAIVKEDFQSAKSEFVKLNFPDSYPKYNEYKVLEKKCLIKRDQLNYKDIKSLIDDMKLSEAQNAISNLNFPLEFPHLDEFYAKLDSKSIKEININLSINNFENATKFYESLKVESNRKQQQEIIQKKLETYYLDKSDSIPNAVYSKIINANTSVFKVLKPGKYQLKIDRSGNVFLSDKVIGSSKDISERKFGSFSVKTVSEASLNITETFIPQGSQQFLVSTKKKIYSKPNGKKYKAVFLGGPGILGGLSGHQLVETTFDGNIKKNQLRTIQPSLKKLVVNNKIEIPQNVENVSIKEEKIKTRWLAIGTRSLALLSGLSWSALRIYEFTLIP